MNGEEHAVTASRALGASPRHALGRSNRARGERRWSCRENRTADENVDTAVHSASPPHARASSLAMKMRPAVTIAPLAGVAIFDSRKLTVQAVASEAETVRVLTSISGATNGLRSPAGPSRRPRKQSATSETSHSSRTAMSTHSPRTRYNGTGPISKTAKDTQRWQRGHLPYKPPWFVGSSPLWHAGSP